MPTLSAPRERVITAATGRDDAPGAELLGETDHHAGAGEWPATVMSRWVSGSSRWESAPSWATTRSGAKARMAGSTTVQDRRVALVAGVGRQGDVERVAAARPVADLLGVPGAGVEVAA